MIRFNYVLTHFTSLHLSRFMFFFRKIELYIFVLFLKMNYALIYKQHMANCATYFCTSL